MAKYQLHIEKNWPVNKKVEVLQQFLGNDYFHDNGMMYAMWYWKDDELRPFKPDDFGPFRFMVPHQVKCSPEGYPHGENSSSTSGLFLMSQAIRYQVTGEPEAMEYCKKAFNSIDTIFKLTESQGQKGFLCKPYGWQASKETSPDQFIYVMNALWEYRKICDYQSKNRIDEMIVSMALWWRQNNYTLKYFAVEWSILPHHCPAMACFNSMAYKVSGNQDFLSESQRLIQMAGSWPTWVDRNRRELAHPTGWPVEKKGVRWPEDLYGREYDPQRKPYLLSMFEIGEMWLSSVCTHYFLQEDEMLSPLLKHALSRQYKYIQLGLREDMLGHYAIQFDLERDIWKPIPHKSRKGSPFTMYDGNLCWQDGPARIPDTAIMAYHHAPEFSPGSLELAKRMLSQLDDDRLRWMIDPDGDQLEPEEEPVKYVLSSDVPGFSVLAYWRAKAYNLPID